LAQATARRDILVADAKALIARGALNSDALDDLTGTHGYKNVAFDLSGLAQMFKAAWPTIQGKTGLQASELEQTDKLALRLAAALAHRENSAESVASATDVRQRIFTLFADTYDQIRRAIGYLRWDEGDVDNIVPSLYAGRTSSGTAKKNPGESKPTTEVAPTAPLTSAVSATTVTAAADKVPVGFPGSDPLGVV
jgi:hypothetical protein